MRGRKPEKWLEDLFPGGTIKTHLEEYQGLKQRELVIVTAAVLDWGLAELLAVRLSRSKKEAADFLGLNGDHRAPCAAFGARMQLGYLLGLFDAKVFGILKTVKAIRNVFAHHVKVDFADAQVKSAIGSLADQWKAFFNAHDAFPTFEKIDALVTRDDESERILLLTLSCLQHLFFIQFHQISPIRRVTRSKRTIPTAFSKKEREELAKFGVLFKEMEETKNRRRQCRASVTAQTTKPAPARK